MTKRAKTETVVGRRELDRETICTEPDCRAAHPPAILRPSCHPHVGLSVVYAGGSLVIRCFLCSAHVMTVAVEEARHDA